MVSYVSAQTSTSGILVEDVLHLTTEDSDPESVKAYITFGYIMLFHSIIYLNIEDLN